MSVVLHRAPAHMPLAGLGTSISGGGCARSLPAPEQLSAFVHAVPLPVHDVRILVHAHGSAYEYAHRFIKSHVMRMSQPPVDPYQAAWSSCSGMHCRIRVPCVYTYWISIRVPCEYNFSGNRANFAEIFVAGEIFLCAQI